MLSDKQARANLDSLESYMKQLSKHDPSKLKKIAREGIEEGQNDWFNMINDK